MVNDSGESIVKLENEVILKPQELESFPDSGAKASSSSVETTVSSASSSPDANNAESDINGCRPKSGPRQSFRRLRKHGEVVTYFKTDVDEKGTTIGNRKFQDDIF